MSSKVSIAWSEPNEGEASFVLYRDELDSLAVGGPDSAPLYLRLVGVGVELYTLLEGGATVTITLPGKLAEQLGLLRLPPGAVFDGEGQRAAK